ncbi:hypothetical protein C8Q79DRAFT_1008688 [Trametes meyenii]|nr:hypothetical protein C8Q79DRAFT_1008688 [Trametes meyenii]
MPRTQSGETFEEDPPAGFIVTPGDTRPIRYRRPRRAKPELTYALAPPPRRVAPPQGSTYDPYPYPATWKFFDQADSDELWFWNHRADVWAKDPYGERLRNFLDIRILGAVTYAIARKQSEAKKAYQDALLAAPPPPEPGIVDEGVAVDFATVSGERGVPVKMLMMGRRALERGMMDPKGRCFEGFGKDTVWVRINWPAYPDHVPSRSVLVSMRVSVKNPRRPVKRLELAVSLSGLITQYYSEVSTLEPAPEFAHLALGPAEGRISLYGLRMISILAAADGMFDLLLVVDTPNGDDERPFAEGAARLRNGTQRSTSAAPYRFASESIRGSVAPVAEAGPSTWNVRERRDVEKH